MKKLLLLAFLSASTLLASGIKITDAYVRATPPGLPNSAAFMSLENETSQDIAIIKVSSSVAKAVELHTHDMKDGVMKMYQVAQIDVPKKGKTVLKPGGFHVMFIGLNHPLKKGETVSFTLELSNGSSQTVTAPIKTVMGGMKHHNMNHNHMDHSMHHNN